MRIVSLRKYFGIIDSFEDIDIESDILDHLSFEKGLTFGL